MADLREFVFSLLGRETISTAADKAAKGLDKLGDTLDATGRDAKALDREVEQAEAALRALAVQFARTQDAAERVDLSKQMRKQQTEVRRLTRARDLLPQPEQAATEWGLAFMARLGPVMARVPMGPVGVAIAGALAVGFVPVLGAAVGGAVLGGVGVGGVVGGLALAARDSRVQAAGKALGATVMADLDESAGRFVVPAIRGIGIIRDAWADVAADVDGIAESTAGYVEPLARGLGGLIREVGPGLREAAAAAGPIVREISEGLPRAGRAVSELLGTLADNADEGASAVRWLFMAFEEGVGFVGGVIDVLGDFYRVLLEASNVAGTVGEALFGWVPGIGDLIDSNNAKVDKLREGLDKSGPAGAGAGDKIAGGLRKAEGAARAANAGMVDFQRTLQGFRDAALSAEEAEIRLEAAIDEAAEAAKRGKRGIDTNTAAGRENRSALLGIVSAAKASSAAILESTGSHDLAAKATERGRAQFLAAAKAMGVEEQQAIDLANKLFGIPDDVYTDAHFEPDNAGVSRWKKTLSGIDRHIFIRAEFDLVNNKDVAMALRLGRLSRGGPVREGGPKGVDRHPYLLASGEHVLSAEEVDAAGGHAGVERLRAALRGDGGALAVAPAGQAPTPAGGGVVHQHYWTVNVPATANPAEVGRAVVEAVQAYERSSGAGWRR